MTTAVNHFSGAEYKGGNALALNTAPYKSNQWATYKQWDGAGFQVGKGQHGTKIMVVREDDVKKKTIVRYFTVFNMEQVTNKETTT